MTRSWRTALAWTVGIGLLLAVVMLLEAVTHSGIAMWFGLVALVVIMVIATVRLAGRTSSFGGGGGAGGGAGGGGCGPGAC